MAHIGKTQKPAPPTPLTRGTLHTRMSPGVIVVIAVLVEFPITCRHARIATRHVALTVAHHVASAVVAARCTPACASTAERVHFPPSAGAITQPQSRNRGSDLLHAPPPPVLTSSSKLGVGVPKTARNTTCGKRQSLLSSLCSSVIPGFAWHGLHTG